MRSLCIVFRLLLLPVLLLAVPAARAQTGVPVVMLSDIHFDPFHDPGKLSQLRAAPIERWPAILNAPPSATHGTDLVALQSACGARALDTDWPLLKSALAAAQAAQPRPIFVTLSGDLLAHQFPCRFARLTPNATPADLSAFAAKTVSFVLLRTRLAFPRIPVYATLGNNDSGCVDYRETPASTFLQSAAAAIGLAAANALPGKPQSLDVTPEGDYAVPLPAPIQHARLLVLDNIFESHAYNTCAAAADRAPEKAQIDWLRAQLADARQHGDHVWVMAHIPPGIDIYASYHQYVFRPASLCIAEARPFLFDTAFADTLLDYADTVRLALFGHTHMDELRLIRRPTPGGANPGAQPAAIPAKLVPSITPVVGNHPGFLVASVDPHTAVLLDWRTFVSAAPDGSSAPWTVAYRFTSAYHLPDFSAASVSQLADGFTADKSAQSPRSVFFRDHVSAGDIGLYSLGIAQIWPAYACAVREADPTAFHDCLCPVDGSAPTSP